MQSSAASTYEIKYDLPENFPPPFGIIQLVLLEMDLVCRKLLQKTQTCIWLPAWNQKVKEGQNHDTAESCRMHDHQLHVQSQMKTNRPVMIQW